MTTKKSIAIILGILILVVICLVLGFAVWWYMGITQKEAAQPSLRIIAPDPNTTLTIQQEMFVQAAATAHGNLMVLLQFYADGYLAGEERGSSESLLGGWEWTPKFEGIHNLSFVAYDQAGNTTTASLQVTAIPSADRDGDGVPDAQDTCPDESGPVASDGCALVNDRDHDGISDAEDICPDESGELEYIGCLPISIPDRDLDGVPDSDDRCPDIVGLPEWDGCPAGAWVTDSDADGIPDFLDTCPEDAGLVDTGGCPVVAPSDSDGDGVLDSVDACPDKAGPVDRGGCPVTVDSDGDGIADAEDLCPDEAGLEDYDGCLPEEGFADTDGDGVIDAFDMCVDQPGPIENDGCPLADDSDGDGVLDVEDNCPDSPGPAWNEGCPPIVFEFGTILEVVFPLDICELFPAVCDPDGDGIRNDTDACPDQPGPAENAGCPIYPQDQDGDGVLDAYDECDSEAGDPASMGCPPDNDRDADSVPYELDACPEVAGPPENNGCPRVGRNVNVELEILSMNTDAGWVGTYCYVQLSDFPTMLRLPESGLLGSLGEGSWSLPSDRRSHTMTVTEGGILTAEIRCFGQPGDPIFLPHPLGSVLRRHGYEAWDNQMRHARGEGSGGWFEIIYRLCRSSCP